MVDQQTEDMDMESADVVLAEKASSRPFAESLVNPEQPEGGGIRAGTMARIRWSAIAGQLMALFFARFGLDVTVDLQVTLSIVATSLIFNIYVLLGWRSDDRLREEIVRWHFIFDILHLSALLFVTGGIANPFAILILAPCSVAASVLGRQNLRRLLIMVLVVIVALVFTPFDLPWKGEPPNLPPLLIAGLWIGMSLTLVFLSLYISQVARDGRKRGAALAVTELALAREQQVSAVGALAAAAAHELGTPLGTLLLIARERLQDVSDPELVRADLEVMAGEIDRCRQILAELRAQGRAAQNAHFDLVTIDALVHEAASPHEGRGKTITYLQEDDGSNQSTADAGLNATDMRLVARTPGILHALRNIIENAVGFAETRVILRTGWTGAEACILVDDDGPGFDAAIARRLGEPYLTTRRPIPGKDGGLGLGLFIAKTLLAREGGTIRVMRSADGGARVKIFLPEARV